MQMKRTGAPWVIDPARGALAILSSAVLGLLAVSPAYAFTHQRPGLRHIGSDRKSGRPDRTECLSVRFHSIG
jgi:hypothetical protein